MKRDLSNEHSLPWVLMSSNLEVRSISRAGFRPDWLDAIDPAPDSLSAAAMVVVAVVCYGRRICMAIRVWW